MIKFISDSIGLILLVVLFPIVFLFNLVCEIFAIPSSIARNYSEKKDNEFMEMLAERTRKDNSFDFLKTSGFLEQPNQSEFLKKSSNLFKNKP